MIVVIGGRTALDNIHADRILCTYPSGVYLAQISAFNSETNQYMTKANSNGETLMFPQTWTVDHIEVEVNSVYINQVDDLDSIRRAEGMQASVSNSGACVEGYIYPIVATFPSAEQE